MSKGLRKLFCNLAIAAKKAEDRRSAREKLHGYLRKVKIISSRTAKQSVIHNEINKLEKHLIDVFDKRLHIKDARGMEQERTLSSLKRKEAELNAKIERLNKLLFRVGKKVNIEKFRKELGKGEPSFLEDLEEKLYAMEAKYHVLEQKYPQQDFSGLKEKISTLKEKIRELKR